MKLSTIKSEGLSKEFKVVIPANDIKPVFETKLSAYAKNFSMPGFRKGKVPIQHVKARYGYRAFQETAETLIQETQKKALEQEKLKTVAAPKISVEKIEDENTDIEYTLSVDVMPDMPSVDFKQFKADKLAAEISDKDIETFIKEQFKDFSMYGPAEEKAKAALNGAVRANTVFKIDEKDQKPNEGVRIELTEDLKEDKIVAGLIGAKAGDVKVIALDPFNDKGKERTIECQVTVLEVLKKETNKFDDAFAKELGFESFDKLKEHTLENLKKSANSKARACLKRELLDFIDVTAKFEVPSSMVEAELESILQQVKADMLEAEKQEADEAALREEYLDIANRRVRLGLLLSELGNARKITVSNQELTQEVYRIAAQTGSDVKKLIDYIQKNPASLNSIQAPLFEEKVVDALLSELKPTEKKVSMKELDQHYDDVLNADMPGENTASSDKKSGAKVKTEKTKAKTEKA